jgi:hypothetical protein
VNHISHLLRSAVRALSLVFLLLAANPFSASGQHRYFYHNLPYGSEALYNPVSLILNGSYDIIQNENRSNEIFKLPYGQGAANVFKNLGNPFSMISEYGWWNFIKREVFPLSMNVNDGQWWPNYELHLIGGGMTSVMMAEWYEDHGFASPMVWSVSTMTAYHLMNEFIENGSYQGNNVDPISDVYLFDIGGILLFTSEPVRRFFSEELHLTDWSLQPMLALNNGTLQNNGQYFSLKWKFPFSDSYSLFHYFGLRGLFGVSKRFETGEALSVGAGVRSESLKLLDPRFFLLTTVLKWEVGIFYDRNNSLLASFFFGGTRDNPVTLNIYPGIIKFGKFSPGVWANYSRNFGVGVGITTVWAPGVAVTGKHGEPE